MTMDTETLAALRHTAELYAAGADRRDETLWRKVLAPDVVIEGPGFATQGLDQALGSLAMLDTMFRTTRHLVHQVVAEGDGEAGASGETYCTAEHLMKEADQILVWALRYQDRWTRIEGEWRFAARRLVIDWEEFRDVKPSA
jgi:ketosteroid isomerase-like protein